MPPGSILNLVLLPYTLIARLFCKHYWQEGVPVGHRAHPQSYQWSNGAGDYYRSYYCVRCNEQGAFIGDPNRS